MPEPAKRLALILFLWVAGLLAGAQFAKVAVLLPDIGRSYPGYGHSVAWLLTLVSMVGALFGVVAAAVANRFSARAVLSVSLVGAAAMSVWQSTFPSFPVMAFSRVLEGICHLGIVVTAPALMAQHAPDRWRGQVMALWSTFFGVSFAIVALVGLPFVERYGVPVFFQVHGGLALACLAGILFCLRDVPVAVAAPAGGSRPEERIWQYLSAPVFWPGICWVFYTLTFLALLTILPGQMPQDIRAGITSGMSLISIGVSLTLLPILLVRVRATTIVIAGFVLAVAVLALSGGAVKPWNALALFAALGLVQGSTFAAVVQLNASIGARTMGYGVMAQAGNIGNLGGTPLLLHILGLSGVAGMLWATVALYVAAAMVLLLLLARAERLARTPPSR